VILEHAILPVRSGDEAAFEAAFDQARPLISSQPGFRNLVLSRSIVKDERSTSRLHGQFRLAGPGRDGVQPDPSGRASPPVSASER
jgi:hypothetical protein